MTKKDTVDQHPRGDGPLPGEENPEHKDADELLPVLGAVHERHGGAARDLRVSESTVVTPPV